MKILPINCYIPNFKSTEYKDDEILGYDDYISEDSRRSIRKWQEAYYMPYYDCYKKECNLSEYEMQKVLNSLMKKTKTVDCNKVSEISAFNVRAIDETSYRGSTLVNQPRSLRILKEAGIERVIDLVGYYGYENRVQEADLEYFSPEFGRGQLGIWEEDCFKNKEEVLADELRGCPDELRNDKNFIECRAKSFDKYSRKSVERFVKFIETVQKDYFYIGCEYGTFKTDEFLLLNDIFNPKAKPKSIPTRDLFKLDMMTNLYEKLTPEDKQRMKWTKEYDQKVLKRIKELEEKIIKSNEDRWCNMALDLRN